MPKTVVVATNQGTRAVIIVVTITISFHAWIVSCTTGIVFPVASLSSFPICNLQLEWYKSLFDQHKKFASKRQSFKWNHLKAQHQSGLPLHLVHPWSISCLLQSNWQPAVLVDCKWKWLQMRINEVLAGKETSVMRRIAKHCLASSYSRRCKCRWYKIPHRQQGCSSSALTLYGEFYLKK